MTLDTVLPILALAALGVAVPWGFMRFLPDSLRGLAVAVGLSIMTLTCTGALLFALLYADDLGLEGLAAAFGPGALLHFFDLGVRAALIWGPVLALTVLGFAQGIERRRGARMAARDSD